MKSSGFWSRPLLVGVMVAGLVVPSAAFAQIIVGSPDTDIAKGESSGVTVSISGTNGQAATVSDEVEFDADQFDIDCPGGICVGTSCTLDPRLSATHILQATRPGGGNSLIYGVLDTTPPVATFTDGPLFTCTFSAKAGATVGSYPLTSVFLEVANTAGDALDSSAEYGNLNVIEPPTAVPTNTSTPTSAATNTPTRTNTPVPPTNTATRTVTNTAAPSSADDGCNMNPNAGSLPLWLFLPLAVLPLLRARTRP